MTKLNIILDLDQTLISAEADEEYDFAKYKSKAKLFEYKDMEGYYLVFSRPGLQEFLDFLFTNFNVSVWTAASKDYALFIIDKIILAGKANRKLDYIFFSYHCDKSKKEKHGSKDLTMLWDVFNLEGYTKENTIIIDDNDEVRDNQPDNVLVAPAFEFTEEGSDKDTFLYKIKSKLRKMKKKGRIIL
jgi:TFIIF-interacting CTD phosphatase-like protein